MFWKYVELLLPYGYIEYRRRLTRLREQGICGTKTDPLAIRKIDRAVARCRFNLLPEEIRHILPRSTVVDVGANKGQFSHALLDLTQVQQLILFEPLRAFQPRLERLLHRVPKGRLITSAVGDRYGHVAFHVTEASQWASILTPIAEVSELYRTSDGKGVIP